MASHALSALFDSTQEKICSKCGVTKPFHAFHKSKRHSTGFSSQCRDCDSARHNNGVIGSKSKCLECGSVFQARRGGQKYCSNACRHACRSRARQSRKLADAIANGRRHLGELIQCLTCNGQFERRARDHRYCDVCKTAATAGVGLLTCCDCGVECARTGPTQKRCKTCAEINRKSPPPKPKAPKFCIDCGECVGSRWLMCSDCGARKRRAADAQRQKERRADPVTGKIMRQREQARDRPYDKEYMSEYERRRKQTDPKYALNIRMRSLVRSSLKRKKGGRSWKSMVEYSIDDLMYHLERQFLPGMSWENRGDWHIDHIVPISSFDFSSPDDDAFKACWAITNLRPLWAAQNVAKSDKRIYLI